MRRLKHQGARTFVDAVRDALVDERVSDAPRQTVAVGKIWWPLVLTTNYDDWFLWQSFGAHKVTSGLPRMRVKGRGPRDCMEVLEVLHLPSRPVLWALQGFVGGQHPRGRGKRVRPDLAHELVIGHEEYRRVTFTEPWYRRAFSEVFRRRSLLFLGSGLADPYLLDLFGQVIELTGPNPLPHFALVPEGEVDVDFLTRRLGITPIVYSHHGEVPEFVDALRRKIEGELPRVSHWSYAFGEPRRGEPRPPTLFDVVRGDIPLVRRDGVALAVSAEVLPHGRPVVSQAADRLLRKEAGAKWRDDVPDLEPGAGVVQRVGTSSAFLCVARDAGS